MKKLTMDDAASIVGGTKSCVSKFEWQVAGGRVTCRQITICSEKDGKQTSAMGGEAPGRCNPF